MWEIQESSAKISVEVGLEGHAKDYMPAWYYYRYKVVVGILLASRAEVL